MLNVVLIGYGAIGQAICRRLQGSARVLVTHVVVRSPHVAEVQAALAAAGGNIQAVAAVPAGARLVLECAGHEALAAHVLSALKRGTECAVMSVGALSEAGLPERLADHPHRSDVRNDRHVAGNAERARHHAGAHGGQQHSGRAIYLGTRDEGLGLRVVHTRLGLLEVPIEAPCSPRDRVARSRSALSR